MSLFFEISEFGRDRCAVHVGARSFSALALSSFRDALSQSVGKNVQLPCPDAEPPYAVKLVSVNGISESEDLYSGGNEIHFFEDNGNVFLHVEGSLRLEFSLGVLEGNGLDAFSSLTLTIRHLQFQIEPSDDQLVCAPGEAELKPSVSRLDEFDEVARRRGLDPIEVARVEGMLRYSGLASVVRNSMAAPRTVDLRRLFPGIVFHGRIEFRVSTDGEQLFVTGSNGATRRPESHCECADVGDGIGPVNPGKIESEGEDTDQSEATSHLVAGITLGGPSSVNADSVVGTRGSGQGANGLFMPASMAMGLVGGPFPGVRFDLGDEGFIGWKAAAFIDFSKPNFKLDPEHGRLLVTLSCRVEIYGGIHVDLGKLGKIRVTTFSVEQAGSGSNTVTIGFHAAVQAGELFLKPVLEDVSIGNFDVHMQIVTLLGTPFGAPGAVIGFIVDKILGQLIAWQIPIRLDRELRNYMARTMFPIMDAYYSAQIEGLQRRRDWKGDIRNLGALYSGAAERGFLFSSGPIG